MNDLKPKEIATGVYCLSIGIGIKQSNIYFVQSGSSWVLIDAVWRNCSQLIKTTSESLFGMDTRPVAILLTHIQPDHSGSAPELAEIWRVPVYVHPDEMPLASGKLIPEYFNPLDRWLIVPLLKLMPRRAIDPSAGIPGLPDWQLARESVAVLAALEPRVLACGHGIAMIGSGTTYELHAFSDRFSVLKRELPHLKCVRNVEVDIQFHFQAKKRKLTAICM
jgi:hypothetical protein